MDIKSLIQTACEAGEKSYSPYSRFRVGAALLCKNGKVFTGTNVENRSNGATICAERTAITKAVSEGIQDFDAICIVGLDYEEKLPPCGICRQVISEFSKDIKIIIANPAGDYEILTIEDLLPLYELKGLKKE